jgi:hypothetical protein
MHLACAPARTRAGHLELADVVRAHGESFAQRHVLRPEERAALRAIERCRTAVLGGHLEVCTECGYQKPAYNSCRNRHCPKCQALAQARWIDKRVERTLPVHYFHVVFTLPAELRAVAKRYRETVFDILFASASHTLLKLGDDPKRLGAQLGITMVLHTWTRDLRFHPHVHAIVTGGGLSQDGSRWIRAGQTFLFPVHVMGALFRGKMIAALESAHERRKLDLSSVDVPALWETRWVVYAKRPFGGPQQVIRYLGRYTHRVGISNSRLVEMDERGVTFRTKTGLATVAAEAFLARFLQHVLPPRFVKIRHYGLHSASHAATRLGVAKRLLAPTQVASTPAHDTLALIERLTGIDVRICPACLKLTLVRRPLPEQSRAPPARAA